MAAASPHHPHSLQGDGVGSGGVGVVQFLFGGNRLLGHENAEPHPNGGLQLPLRLHQLHGETARRFHACGRTARFIDQSDPRNKKLIADG